MHLSKYTVFCNLTKRSIVKLWRFQVRLSVSDNHGRWRSKEERSSLFTASVHSRSGMLNLSFLCPPAQLLFFEHTVVPSTESLGITLVINQEALKYYKSLVETKSCPKNALLQADRRHGGIRSPIRFCIQSGRSPTLRGQSILTIPQVEAVVW